MDYSFFLYNCVGFFFSLFTVDQIDSSTGCFLKYKLTVHLQFSITQSVEVFCLC